MNKRRIGAGDLTVNPPFEPELISVSRATDIPAFHMPWFMARLRAGFCLWRNPFNSVVRRVDFHRVRGIIFWSKNPRPLLPYLNEIADRGLAVTLQYTLNNYEPEGLEPGLPPLAERLETFALLVEQIGKEGMIWRYDPLLLSERLDVDTLLDRVARLGSVLAPQTRRLIFSFLVPYPKAMARLRRLDPSLRPPSCGLPASTSAVEARVGAENNGEQTGERRKKRQGNREHGVGNTVPHTIAHRFEGSVECDREHTGGFGARGREHGAEGSEERDKEHGVEGTGARDRGHRIGGCGERRESRGERDEETLLVRGLAALRDEWNRSRVAPLRLSACAGTRDFSALGILPMGCVDGPELARRIGDLAPSFATSRDRGQRKACLCAVSKDIGTYSSCGHGCVYCYANHAPALVAANLARRNADHPLLCAEDPLSCSA